ncbi:MarR family winged helix-turn-helix transcriptional regulator [Kitasatospora arboriphila]
MAIERAQRLTDVITRLRRALRSSIRTDYPWESLPMAQVELLQTLAAAPMRVGELAARQRLAPNTVSGLVGKLLEAGFVDRQADPGDRRTARIALTEAAAPSCWTGAGPTSAASPTPWRASRPPTAKR